MRKNKKNRKNVFKKLFSSRFFLFILIIVFAGIAKMTFSKFEEWGAAKASFDAKKETIASKEVEKETLEEEIKNSKNERFVEKATKQKLGLVSPGEKVIYVLNEREEETEEEEEKGIIEKLKEIFTE